MRRLIVVLSVLSALVVPLASAPPAGAATVGACTLQANEAYQHPLMPLSSGDVAPQPRNLALALRLSCVGVNTTVFNLAGLGGGTASCAAEVASAPLTDAANGAAGNATWVRVGSVGWMFVQIQTMGGPSTQYAYEGPIVWAPDNGDLCLTQPVFTATMVGLGPHMGL